MILTNFQINFQGWIAISLTHEGAEYDLHNYGCFDGFNFDVRDHSLEMAWQVSRYLDGSAEPESTVAVLIHFSNVDFFEVLPRDPAMPLSEDVTLATITPMEPIEDLSNYHLGDPIPALSSYNKPDETKHLLFRFWGGQMIRVGAKSANMAVVCRNDSARF